MSIENIKGGLPAKRTPLVDPIDIIYPEPIRVSPEIHSSLSNANNYGCLLGMAWLFLIMFSMLSVWMGAVTITIVVGSIIATIWKITKWQWRIIRDGAAPKGAYYIISQFGDEGIGIWPAGYAIVISNRNRIEKIYDAEEGGRVVIYPNSGDRVDAVVYLKQRLIPWVEVIQDGNKQPVLEVPIQVFWRVSDVMKYVSSGIFQADASGSVVYLIMQSLKESIYKLIENPNLIPYGNGQPTIEAMGVTLRELATQCDLLNGRGVAIDIVKMGPEALELAEMARPGTILHRRGG